MNDTLEPTSLNLNFLTIAGNAGTLEVVRPKIVETDCDPLLAYFPVRPDGTTISYRVTGDVAVILQELEKAGVDIESCAIDTPATRLHSGQQTIQDVPPAMQIVRIVATLDSGRHVVIIDPKTRDQFDRDPTLPPGEVSITTRANFRDKYKNTGDTHAALKLIESVRGFTRV